MAVNAARRATTFQLPADFGSALGEEPVGAALGRPLRGGDIVTVKIERADAYDLYGTLIREYGPANVSTDMSWPDAMAVFTQGQAGFYVEANSLYKNATDPTKSQVADTVGFAAFPAGPAGSRPYNIPSWALGVNAGSTNIDNAWKFIEWATSKEQTLLNQQAGVPSARTSVWADPQATQDYPPDLLAAAQAAADDGVGHDRPESPEANA